MRDDLIAPFMKTLGSKPTNQTDKFVTGPCPLAYWTHSKGVDKHPSFGVARGPGHYGRCFACGFRGPLGELVWRVRSAEKSTPSGRPFAFAEAISILEAQTALEPLIASFEETLDEFHMSPPNDNVLVFPESRLSGLEDAYTDTEVHPYLASRAINCTTARRLDIRWDAEQQRVCFPIRDLFGRLCGIHGRSVDLTTELPYLVYTHNKKSNPHVWYGEHWLDLEKTVVLTESVFDLARVYPIWSNVMCPRSANFSPAALKRLDGVTRVLTLFDNDKAGDVARSSIDSLKGCSVTHLSVDPYKDPGETPEDVLREILTEDVLKPHIFLAMTLPF